MRTKRIAYVTYEYPPDIHAGGIATYVYEASRMMVSAGWEVEIFAGSLIREGIFEEEGVLVNRIKIKDAQDFRIKVVPIFINRHNSKAFDIYETPEINSNALIISENVHDLPLVTKLQTPVVLQLKLLNWYRPFLFKIRYVFGALRRGKIDLGFWRENDPDPTLDDDYNITIKSDAIISPSLALKKWANEYWQIPNDRIKLLANLFTPSENKLKQVYNTDRKYLTFIGKLNVHKGMVALTKALPKILKDNPDIICCFIGNDGTGPNNEPSMRKYMEQKLGGWVSQVLFTGTLKSHEIEEILNKSKVCIFPSIWEAFGYVALEAMSAGVPVIVSSGSGMAEIVGENEFGLLIDPLSPKDIANKTSFLLKNNERLLKYSELGRKRVLKDFTREVWQDRHTEFYNSIIENFKLK